MSRIFQRVKYSDYLGESRPLLDIYTLYVASETYYILYENSDVMTAENGDLIEFEH